MENKTHIDYKLDRALHYVKVLTETKAPTLPMWQNRVNHLLKCKNGIHEYESAIELGRIDFNGNDIQICIWCNSGG